MDTQIDWQHELDTSFGSAPDVPAGLYVASGRRAVRRRRAGTAVVVAALVVGGGAAWATGPGSPSPRGDAPVATSGPAPGREQASEESERETRRDRLERMREAADAQISFLGNPGALTDHGLVLAPKAGPVLQRVPNPMGYTPAQGSSLGIRVMYEGREQYSLLALFADGGTSTSTNDASGDFDSWLDNAVRNQRTLDVANGVTPSAGDSSDGPWLVLQDGRVAAAREGVVIVEERVGVDLGPSFADGATRTGAVRLVVDGRTEYAAYRVVGGELDVVPGGSFDSFAAFLGWAREQYASGQGMR